MQEAAPQPVVAAHSAPEPESNGRRPIGQTLPDGSIMFKDLDTCCGHIIATDPDGSVLYHFD